MKPIPMDAAVVVLAAGHNPTILHPSFLESQGIVEPGLKLAEPPVSTPAIATVKYDDGLTFVVESKRFQLIDRGLKMFAASRVPDLATKYISALPHVRYTAVGVNFTMLVECESPIDKLRSRFLKVGAWNNDAMHPSSLGITLVYNVRDAKLTMKVDAGEGHLAGEPKPRVGVISHGNYHFELPETDPLPAAKAVIARFHELAVDFVQRTETVVGTGE